MAATKLTKTAHERALRGLTFYRRFCMGKPGKEGALGHVVKSLRLEGIEVKIDTVRRWSDMLGWDQIVEITDAPAYAAVVAMQNKLQSSINPADAHDMQALSGAVDELTRLAHLMLAKAQVAVEQAIALEPAEIKTYIELAAKLVDTSIKSRLALMNVAGANAKTISANVNLEPPPAPRPQALDAAPNLAGTLAHFARASVKQ